MSDEVREFLRRGAGMPRPAWGFDTVWRRARRQRARNTALKAAATVGIVAVVAVSVPLIRSNQRADDRGNPIAPASNATWQRIPAAPIEGRTFNVAVWTGEEMLIWGGDDGESAVVNGAAFNRDARDWRLLSEGPLEVSDGRTAVWTGKAMLLWGGETGDGSHGRPDSGAAYDPSTDTWTELPASPYWSLASHSAVWTGEEMVVWGGVGMEDRGAAFDPGSGAWRTIEPAPIDGRFGRTAVWTGTEMIAWGGREGPGLPLATGAAYDPQSDSWRELPPAPISERDSHAAIWTGEEMVVWGGWNSEGVVSDGAAYDPLSNTWRELPRAPISSHRNYTSAVWTGREMIVVGADGDLPVYADGDLAAYSPEENEWAILPDPPMGEMMSPTLLSADGELILWGGWSEGNDEDSNEGAILDLGQ